MDFADYDTRLAAYAIVVDDDGRVLPTLWNGGVEPASTLPGGEVELHESPEQGALRELLEETGYQVELSGLLGVDVTSARDWSQNSADRSIPARSRLHSHSHTSWSGATSPATANWNGTFDTAADSRQEALDAIGYAASLTYYNATIHEDS